MYQWADAILLIYQETHILSKDPLERLLKRERDHIAKYELVLEECIEQGAFREFNIRIVANLIKMMIDSWVLKRWDLRGYANRLEMERYILDLVFNGLLMEKGIFVVKPCEDS
jgi:hypothetical protein